MEIFFRGESEEVMKRWLNELNAFSLNTKGIRDYTLLDNFDNIMEYILEE